MAQQSDDRVSVKLPELELPDDFHSCDWIYPDYPFNYMHVGWFDIEIDHYNLCDYLKRPNEFLADLQEIYDYQVKMREDPDYVSPWYPNRPYIPQRVTVYKGLGKPMSLMPWDWTDRTDKYLTVVYETLKDHRTIAVSHYVKLSEHERTVTEVKRETSQTLRNIVREEVGGSITSTVKRIMQDSAITLSKIEQERERLENQRDELERRIAELNALEEQVVIQEKAKPNRRQPVDTKGYVYLLQTTVGYWKIGRTRNPDNRLKTFSVKLPFPVEYTHLIQCDDMYTAEKGLHRQFAAKRVNGSEFFALDEQDVDYIKSLATL